MPTRPKGEKRPADVIGNAVKVMRILTGEEPEDYGAVVGDGACLDPIGRRIWKTPGALATANETCARRKIEFGVEPAEQEAGALGFLREPVDDGTVDVPAE